MPSYAPLEVDTVAQLKLLPVADGAVVLCVGANAISDGRGGFFRFDASSTAAEDMTYLNVVASSTTGTGRWLRVFQRVTPTPAGVWTNLGGFKSNYASGLTDANGRFTVYNTVDGTPTGNGLFATIVFMDGVSLTPATNPNDVIIGNEYSISPDMKTLVFQFSRGNVQTLGATITAIAGLVIQGFRAAPAGMQVGVRIDGY